MTIAVPPGWVEAEVASRVAPLQEKYADHPLVKRIDYRIGVDWSDDPAVYITAVLASKETPVGEVAQLAAEIRADLLSLVGTDEIGLHSYLHFAD